MNEEVLKEAKENVNQFITEYHIKLIQKGITKAIKTLILIPLFRTLSKENLNMHK